MEVRSLRGSPTEVHVLRIQAGKNIEQLSQADACCWAEAGNRWVWQQAVSLALVYSAGLDASRKRELAGKAQEV